MTKIDESNLEEQQRQSQEKCLPCLLHYGTGSKLFAYVYWDDHKIAEAAIIKADTREEAAKKFIDENKYVPRRYESYCSDLESDGETIPTFEIFKEGEVNLLLDGNEYECIAEVK